MQAGRVTLVLAAAGLVAAGCGGSSGKAASSGNPGPVQHPASLIGDVGHNDEFLISLKDPSGAPIRNLQAGSYQVKVDDESGIHDFHLTGNGVNKTTSVPGTGTQTWTVNFSPGTYTFLCDTHPTQMKSKFTVS
ncbi:MAG TPA: hypothetical protein VFH54_18710 [Mycobacteriales bacterium]|nr:hypothetical protein [Mycobacteriales bacterium]